MTLVASISRRAEQDNGGQHGPGGGLPGQDKWATGAAVRPARIRGSKRIGAPSCKHCAPVEKSVGCLLGYSWAEWG